MSHLLEILSELGFSVEEKTSANLRHLEKDLAHFITKVNKEYSIFPYELEALEFSSLSLYEPWFLGFLKRALDKKRQSQKELS